MSDTISTKPGLSLPSDADPRALEVQANRIVDDSRAALAAAGNEAQAAAHRLSALKGVCEHIEALASQLTTATFRASGEAINSSGARGAIVSFVEELGDMAKHAAKAAAALRGVLGTRPYVASTAEAACKSSEAALTDLSRIVHQLAEKADRPVVRTIEVEHRDDRRKRPATSLDIWDDETTPEATPWSLGRRRSSGYKN